MLAAPSSLLLSAVQLAPAATDGDTAASNADAAPGFAELLSGLVGKPAGDAASREGTTGQAPGADAAALASALAAAAGGEQPATGMPAAIATGKDLPDGLPLAAETHSKVEPAADAAAAALASNPIALLLAPGTPPQPLQTRAAPRLYSAGAGVPHAATQAALAVGKPKSDAAKTDGSQAPAVAITVAAHDAEASDAVEAASPAPATPLRAKSALGVDPVLGEPQLAPPAAAAAPISPSGPPAPSAHPHATSLSAPAQATADIGAALDRLTAAREALMPAEAALTIDHAEFGEVSIRLEQSADGRLSAELAAADPGLQRAVAAATAADRGSAAGADGDGARSGLAHHRGSAVGGEAAQGERGPSTGDRELPQRRIPTRSQARQAHADTGSGIFA